MELFVQQLVPADNKRNSNDLMICGFPTQATSYVESIIQSLSDKNL